ncbi:MAG TPA: TetR/AcrR family transcriptional regulator [Polyangiaceae bacterium]
MATPRPSRLARKPRAQYHHGDLRRALLQAAVRTLQKQGLDALTLRSVGDELGVSRSALYRHFSDKAALLTAVASEGFRLLHDALRAAWEQGGKGRAGSLAMGEAYVSFALEHPWHYRVMFGSGFDLDASDPALRQAGAAALEVLVESLVELQAAGLARQEDVRTQANFVWAVVHGVAMLAIDGSIEHQGADAKALARYAVERLHTGIAPAVP